jgi:H/ACA ribonucleoprotein complex non-core subunit NAF1
MDPMEDLYEPDEARPAKRVRLEAPLAITEEVQEEVIDDGDWDDIYGNAATPQRESSPDGGVRVAPPPVEDVLSGAIETSIKTDVIDGTPEEPLDDGDKLVARREVADMDEASTQIMGEASLLETGPARKDETVKDDEVQSEDNFYSKEAKDAQQQLAGVTSTLATETDNPQIKPEESSATAPKLKPGQDAEFVAAAAAQKKDGTAEWQFDSSDAESSSDSDSDSSSDDSSDASDSGSEGGYELLDPATAAKMLMSGDGEDDDGDKNKNKTGDHQPRTANEVKDEVVPKPDVLVTEDMKMTHLGFVDRTVENMVLIKAVTPGEFQVLESGSVLCNEQREVIGAVAETFGRVQEPMYSVAFTNAQEIEDMGLKFGARVFYVDNHSTFVFTQPLKNMKGTDASNIHDEEVGEDEIEFSDDEKEAEYKRLKKLAKRGGRGGLSRSAFNEERAERSFGTPGHDSGFTFVNGSDAPQQQYGGGMNYDDEDVQEEFYSPLKRPDNLSQLMAGGGPPPPPPMPFRGNFGGRGRGDRGRGRGDRGRGRGGFDHRNQRGDRGGFRQDDRKRGSSGQQNGQRGPAHSFPDRHNNGNNARANARRHHNHRPNSNASQSSSSPPPPQQQYPPYKQQYQPQPQSQSLSAQTYQFNGYTFQYGNPHPQTPASQPGYYQHQQPAERSSPPAIPAGAYVNPAFFQNQQSQGQWTQPQQQQQPSYGQWPPQQYQQYAQPGATQAPHQPQNNLADILRQLGGYQQQQR